MTTDKFNKAILICCAGLLILLLTDSYVVPAKQDLEIVRSTHRYTQRGRSGFGAENTYTLQTNNREFDVPLDLYMVLADNDTIDIECSQLSNIPRQVFVKTNDGIYGYKTGYLNAFFGIVAVPLIMIGIGLTLIFYNKIDWPPGRIRLTYALLILTLLQIFFYLDQ